MHWLRLIWNSRVHDYKQGLGWKIVSVGMALFIHASHLSVSVVQSFIKPLGHFEGIK
jgi:hypothetical protein